MSTPTNKILKVVPTLHKVCEKAEESLLKVNLGAYYVVKVPQFALYVTPNKIAEIYLYIPTGYYVEARIINLIYHNTEFKYLVSPGKFWYTRRKYHSIIHNWDHIYGRFHAKGNILVYSCR
jgi:hypothetical protein